MFVVRTKNNSEKNCYIQAARLDGKPWNKCWFYRRDFADGGTLDLSLGPKPNTKWGSARKDWPPSASKMDVMGK